MQDQIIEGYRLSPQQKRLWLLQKSSDSLPFRALCAVLIEGPLDSGVLAAALEDVINRNQILRTTFPCSYGLTVPVQVIAEMPLRLSIDEDLCDLAGQEQMDRLEEIINDQSRSTLDCERGPIVSGSLVHLAKARHMLIITVLSLCTDSTGLRNIVRELSHSYAALVGGSENDFEAMQYIVASEWQNDLFESEDFEVGESFWSRQDLSALDSLKLPFGKQSGGARVFEPRSVAFSIGLRQRDRIEALARRQRVSVSAFFLSCWHILVGRLTRQSGAIIGAGCDGRSDEEMENALGLFSKYLPIRSDLDDGRSLCELLGQINSSSQEVSEWHEWFTWQRLGGVSSDQTNTMFFPLCFDFEEEPIAYEASEVTFSIYKQYACVDRFDLKLRCACSREGVGVEFHYNSALYEAAEIERLALQYRRLLESAIDSPESAIGDLDMLTEEERRQLLVDFNDTFSEYSQERRLQKLFEERVEQIPDACAVVYENDALTYAELNISANRLAHRLRKEGIAAESLVPICVDRSLEMVVAVLGVLKAGAAYVPMDPAYPIERLAFMVRDARAAVLLTQHRMAESFADLEIEKICLDRERHDIRQEGEENPENISVPQSLAYVIYTSGSTGKPKGVMVEHGSPGNLLAALSRAIYANLPESQLVVSLNAPLAFDASVQQLLRLIHGDTVQIIPQEIRTDGKLLLPYLAANRVDVFDCTPSQLEIMLEAGLLSSECAAPRAVLVAGEAIGEGMWKELSDSIEPIFYNIYGPTECTVDATFCRIHESPKSPNIGRPLLNYRLYVLDSQLRLLPVGAGGELYIGGVGVARGYLNQPQLTAERFVPDPFSDFAGDRLYKTGDLGRHLPDGTIEFLGRLDDQVKVRGNRIELGEIESVIAQHPGVRQCGVCVREDEPGDKRVVAYIVATDEGAPSWAELREYLQAKMPSYMVPSAFVELLRLPLTASGKLDRGALPAPATTKGEETVAPRDATELYLFHIWSDILRAENLGVRDNFFNLGGHSLTAVALSSRVSETYGEKVSVRTVFDYPTVEKMARYLRQEVSFLPPSALVPIQPRGRRPPFFCVHAAGGLGHVYIPLARCLGPDQPFYGLQSFELDFDGLAAPTVQEMAARYLAEVRRVQPVGPYQIGGWSFGAAVAYEMAQQLYAVGEYVSLLAILDASLPSSQVDDRPLSEEEMQASLHERVVSYSETHLILAGDEAASMTTGDLIRLIMRHHQEVAREKELAGIMELTETHYLGWFRNQVTNTHARGRYRPKPYPGSVTLFRCANGRQHDYGWSQWALGGVEVYYSDAEHEHFVEQPNAAVVAAQLANCLAEGEVCQV